MAPDAFTAMPVGWLKCAAAPVPSTVPAAAPPASSAVVPLAYTARTRLLFVSVTSRKRGCVGVVRTHATAPGPANRAAVPLPA